MYSVGSQQKQHSETLTHLTNDQQPTRVVRRVLGERTIPLLRSCERCRRRKQKCDGEQPACGRCKTHHTECHYRESGRFRKRFPRNDSSAMLGNEEYETSVCCEDLTLSAATALSSMSTMSNPTTVTPDTATTTATGDSSGLLASDIVAPRVDDIVKQSMSPDSSCDSPSAMPVASTSALGTGGNQLSLLFSVPELSPTVGAELSPNDPLISTPIGAHPLWSTDFHRKQMGGHNVMDPSGVYRAMIDPVQVLKTCDLPDLSNGLPESVLHQMWALIGGLSVDDSTEFGALNLATDHGSKTHTGSYSIGKTSATTGTKRKPENTPQHIDGTLPPPSNRVPQALVHVAQRYRLHEPASTLLAMLRQSLVDADVNMKVRQFWVTLESGNASDFVLLAHLTVAAREAQLSSKINLRHPQHLLETTCFEAARSEWDAGRVEASTGEVYGLLMLSEYGYQTGRNAILWEFAHNALDTARRIVFRNTRYPWHGARLTRLPDEASCDVEYEHILTCYWSAWVRLLTAAQTTRRRLGPQLYTLRSDDDSAGTLMLPEFTAHDMCHFTAQPVVRPGKTVPSAVEFPPMACRHKPHFAYSASLLQCSLMVAEMHDRHIDLLDRQIGPVAFLDALRLWDHRMCRWRACWPPEWEAQMAEMFETAHRINSSKYDNIVPLDPSPIRLYRPVNRRIQSGLSLSDAANNTATVSASGLMHTGSHLFHRSQMTPADSWLTILAALCETARLRMHRIALALLRHRRPQSTIDYHSQSGATVPRQLPLAAVASQFDEPLTRLSESVLTADGDIMYDEMEFHRCQFVSLESARTLQTLFTTVELLGSSIQRLGIWGVFVLEHVIGLHCARLHTSTTTEEQMDALCRLGRLLRQLLSLRRWTSALYVFTGIVKAFVDHSCTIIVDDRYHFEDIPENSPWPNDHVLTLLMSVMRMDPRQFCAFTVPVVFASIASSSTPMPVDMRMRIASLLS